MKYFISRGRFLKHSLVMALTTAMLMGCSSTTNSGLIGSDRKQLLLVSNEQVMQLSQESYKKSIQQARAQNVLDTDPALRARLQRIANRLIAEVDLYRTDADDWDWEVHTIKSDQLNAFVVPGGKIMFYTGIVERLGLTDDEIAAIMGHEMAHVLREHSRERMSSAYATQAGLGIAASIFGLSQGQTELASMASDLGISRPHSRVQESEADQVGLVLMAKAGYNPQAAISLWQKMQRISQGSPPQFLSTHPSSTNRIATLQSLMPQVMPYYRESQQSLIR